MKWNGTKIFSGILAVLGGAMLGGCSSGVRISPVRMYQPPPATPSAMPQIRELSAHVQTAAAAQGDAATAIRSSAIDGKAHTPPEILPVLGQFWDAILAGADRVQNTAQDLAGLHQRMDDLAAQVAAKDAETAGLRAALASANAAIQSEHDARIKAQDAEAKAKSDQAMRLERLLFGVAITSLLGLGGSVTVGLLLHNTSISIAGGAGCLAMAVGCFVLGEVIYYRFWILVGLGVVAAALGVYEYLSRRQATAAVPVKT